jgi:hypothetical protein
LVVFDLIVCFVAIGDLALTIRRFLDVTCAVNRGWEDVIGVE